MTRISDNRIVFGSDFMVEATKKWNEGLHSIEHLNGIVEQMAELTFSNGLMGGVNYELANNKLTIEPFKVSVKGKMLTIGGANNEGGSANILRADASSIINRDSYFVFLEVWDKLLAPGSDVHYYGGTDSGIERTTDTFEKVTQWRLRLVKNLDMTDNPKGLENSRVQPMTSEGITTDKYQYTALNDKKDIFVVGDGSAEAKTLLKTMDGYIYALPIVSISKSVELAPSKGDEEAVPYVSATIKAKVQKGTTLLKLDSVEGLKVGFPVRIYYLVNNSSKNTSYYKYFESEITRVTKSTSSIVIKDGVQPELDKDESIVQPTQLEGSEGEDVVSSSKLETIPAVTEKEESSVLIEDKVVGLESQAERMQDYSITARNKDNFGSYSIVEYRRANDSLFLKSTLEEPDSEMRYKKMTWEFYNFENTLISTKKWELKYDSEGTLYAKEAK